jgi:large subunit ribosomal protein L31
LVAARTGITRCPALPAAGWNGIFKDSIHGDESVLIMKQGIHPEYYETSVSCGCGNKFTTRSTRKELKIDICNECHPFYTGKLKFIDTAGRIEKFKNKFAAAGYASLNRGKKK